MSSRRWPSLSIVTPSLDQGAYLAACMDSVLDQGYPALEYVVMDGGSRDGSRAVIEARAERLTHWQSAPDDGQYDAVQRGFEHTSGEIMTWLNADDMYHPYALFKVAQVFERHPRVQWLTARHSFWRQDGSFEGAARQLLDWSPRSLLERAASGGTLVQQESTFWRRSLWEQAGAKLATGLCYAGDLELWCRFLWHADLYTLDNVLGGFRRHPEQKTAGGAVAYRREAQAVARPHVERLKQHPQRLRRPAPPVLRTDLQALVRAVRDAGHPAPDPDALRLDFRPAEPPRGMAPGRPR